MLQTRIQIRTYQSKCVKDINEPSQHLSVQIGRYDGPAGAWEDGYGDNYC